MPGHSARVTRNMQTQGGRKLPSPREPAGHAVRPLRQNRDLLPLVRGSGPERSGQASLARSPCPPTPAPGPGGGSQPWGGEPPGHTLPRSLQKHVEGTCGFSLQSRRTRWLSPFFLRCQMLTAGFLQELVDYVSVLKISLIFCVLGVLASGDCPLPGPAGSQKEQITYPGVCLSHADPPVQSPG